MSMYEAGSLIIAALALVVSTVVLLLLLKQIKLLSRQVSDAREAIDESRTESELENRRRRQRATMEYMSGTFAKVQELYDLIPAAGSRELQRFLELAMVRDSREFIALRNYLNYLENISAGINMGVFEAEVVYRTIGGRIRRAWRYYALWIEQERHAVGTSKLYDELESCAKHLINSSIGDVAPTRKLPDPPAPGAQ